MDSRETALHLQINLNSAGLEQQVLSRIRRAFGVEVPLRRLFEAATIEALALLVEELLIEHLNSLSEEEAEALLHDDELDE